MPQLQPMTWPAMQQMIQSATLMQGTDELPRVLLDDRQQTIIKIFYPRRSFSTNRFYPYCLRFKRNSHRLSKLGIRCPDVQEVYRIVGHAAGAVHVMRYPILDGQPLRSVLPQAASMPGLQERILAELALFMANLHSKGIFFRGIHLANLLYSPPSPMGPHHVLGRFALLDITTVKYSLGVLSLNKRARNLKHLLHYRDDQHIFSYAVKAQFMQHYLEYTMLGKRKAEKLIEKIFSKYLSAFEDQAK